MWTAILYRRWYFSSFQKCAQIERVKWWISMPFEQRLQKAISSSSWRKKSCEEVYFYQVCPVSFYEIRCSFNKLKHITKCSLFYSPPNGNDVDSLAHGIVDMQLDLANETEVNLIYYYSEYEYITFNREKKINFVQNELQVYSFISHECHCFVLNFLNVFALSHEISILFHWNRLFSARHQTIF